MLLAGDIGGTKVLLGLYEPDEHLPRMVEAQRYSTLDFDGLDEVVTVFLANARVTETVTAACFGVAGPVRGQVAKLTNVPWLVDGSHLAARLNIPLVHILNDLEAMAYSVPALDEDQLSVIRTGRPDPTGNAALIAPGTGLGETLMHNLNGRFVPVPSEGGHADFAARTDREVELLRKMTANGGRLTYEQVVSGPGLVTLHRFVHDGAECPVVPEATADSERPALISTAALEQRCERCVEALELFVGALGAEAGNLGLRSVATAGVYLGGGIAPKILPALDTSTFVDAFLDKAPMNALVDGMPVSVILEPDAALLGAAVAANELAARHAVRGEQPDDAATA